MKSNVSLNVNYAIEFAKSVTLSAIEHNMIPSSNDSSKTAQYVSDFFTTFLNSITESDNQ